jgi:phenylpropionate dioxygenase-like ring-hydroxylating dioxygenase large terminal subunit
VPESNPTTELKGDEVTVTEPTHRPATGTENGPPPEYRCPGSPTPQSVWRHEMGEVPEVLHEHWTDLGTADIPLARYTSRQFHQAEIDTIWRNAWQFVCRIEELPGIGDSVVYDIASLSFLVVRVSETELKGYYNSCLHRGTQLRDSDGRIPQVRCPFHGWTWNLDGTFKEMPSRWDFPHVDPAALCLPEVRVGVFAGFVFINPDRDAVDLEEYLAPMADHFDRWWSWERKAKIAHTAKLVNANWKVVLNAGQESYHFRATHPQSLLTLHEANGQVDYWDHVARLATSVGMLPPEDWASDVTEDDIVAAFSEVIGETSDPDVDDIELEPGQTARDYIAPRAREQMAVRLNTTVDQLPAEEAVDYIQYVVFPNFQIELNGLVLRYRPWNDDPNMALMELMIFAPIPEGAEMPPPAPVQWMEPDQSYTTIPQFGPFGTVMDQDVSNMARVQRGMKAAEKSGATLSRYQESMIRWHHKVLDDYLRTDNPQPRP